MHTSNQPSNNRSPIKNLVLRCALLLTFVLANLSQGQADGARDRFSGGEWRLGNNNQIYQRTDRGWRRVPGYAIDVADGWVIGTDRRSGGYGIYRWNGYRFDRMPGGAVEIDGSYNRPLVINNRGERFEWTGRDWREERGYGSHRSERREERHYDRDDDDRDHRRGNNSVDHRNDRRRPDW
jgi:hypothetical protein